MFRSRCAHAIVILSCLTGPARAGIQDLDVSAFVQAEAVATFSVNDPLLFHDQDAKSVDQNGTFTAAAALAPNSIGTATGFSSISVNSSTSGDTTNVSFTWDGDGAVELDDPVPGAFKNIGSTASGSVYVQFTVVGAPAQYSLSFSTGNHQTKVSLSGGGVGGFFCANDLGDCPTVEDNLQRSGVLPPGGYEVRASASDFCGDCVDGGIVVNCHNNQPVVVEFNDNFNFTLTLNSAPSFRWTSAGGGNFSDGVNWESGQVPGSSDTALVDLGGTVPISFSGSGVKQLLVRNTNLDLLGGQLQLTSTSAAEPSLALGGFSRAALKSGLINCRHVAVGDTPGTSVAALELTGSATARPQLSATGNVLVGSQQPGAINISAGASLAVAGDTTLGSGANGASTVDVSGFTSANGTVDTSTLSGTGQLQIGDPARAEVVVRNGAFLDFRDVVVRRGSLRVDGILTNEHSLLTLRTLSIGGGQASDVTVENGAQLQSRLNTSGFAAIGAGGTLRVRGKGTLNSMDQPSSLTLTEIHAGISGAATVELGPLGLMTLDKLTLGDSNGGNARFTVNAASLFVNVNALITGSGSRLDFSNAGVARFAQTFNFRAQQGDVTVTGPGTFVTFAGSAVIASPNGSGNPTVTVTNGGVFSQESGVQATLQVGDAFGPGRLVINHPIAGFQDPVPAQARFHDVTIERGVIRVEGAGRLGANATLTVRDRLEVDTNLLTFPNVVCDRLVIAANGVVRVCPDGMVQATVIINEPGARIEGRTHVTGSVATGGLVGVGCSPGTLTIDGDFEQSETGVLEMEAAGVGPGQFDVLRVGGAAKLGGTLEVRFIDGYMPKRGDGFDFFEFAGGVTGKFIQVSFPDLAPGFQADLRAEGGALRLTAMNDGVPGAGVVIDPFAAQQAPACGVGLCGAGTAPLLLAASLVVAGLKRQRRIANGRSRSSFAARISQRSDWHQRFLRHRRLP